MSFFVFLTLLIDYVVAQSCRDRVLWPFSSTSIWNMPIGSNASFSDSGIFDESSSHPLPNNFFGDPDFFYTVNNQSPSFKWYNQGHWGQPYNNASYCTVTGNLMGDIRFPSDIIIDNFGNNNAAAILQSDNITIYQMQPIYHCGDYSPILALNWCFKYQNVSILDDGIFGCHGGSGLSSIGGTIRKGELTDNDNINSIKHALKLEFYGEDYYYKGNPSWQWPAMTSDGTGHYGGMNPYFTPGALLSVPSDKTINLTTIPGKKILFALQNYGGYIVDDTATNRGTMCIEYGVIDEFQSKYGYSFNSKKGETFYNDLLAIFKELKLVINNNADNIGGGGKPLQSLAPKICGT